MCGSDIFLGIIAILFPPIAVWVKRGICSADSIINIALCCLGFLPGLLHAWYIISITPDPTYVALQDASNEDIESGRVTYYYVHTNNTEPRYSPASAGQQEYGTVNPTRKPAAGAPATQSGSNTAAASGENEHPDEVPPSYQQAVGDHKVQRP